MAIVRVYELAKELNMDSKDLVDKLKASGINVKNYLSTLDEDAVTKARDVSLGKVSEVIEEKRIRPTVIRRRKKTVAVEVEEETAVEQFGAGDKYFGVCTVIVTLPGTPMFGHGQVEGLRERYGMEFRTPRLDEKPDESLVQGHEWKIFPLLRRRSLFAGADQFQLFDFQTQSGWVNENVLAYSNRHGGERALVQYHNKYATARGWLRVSAARLDKSSGLLRQRSLAEALDLPQSGFVKFRDYVTRREYIRDLAELGQKGLYAELEWSRPGPNR